MASFIDELIELEAESPPTANRGSGVLSSDDRDESPAEAVSFEEYWERVRRVTESRLRREVGFADVWESAARALTTQALGVEAMHRAARATQVHFGGPVPHDTTFLRTAQQELAALVHESRSRVAEPYVHWFGDDAHEWMLHRLLMPSPWGLDMFMKSPGVLMTCTAPENVKITKDKVVTFRVGRLFERKPGR